MSDYLNETRFKNLLGINELDKRILEYELSFEPLINQFEANSMISQKGKSAKAAQLVRNLFFTIENFIRKCGEVAAEFPDLELSINDEIRNVRQKSDWMLAASNEFSIETGSTKKRLAMIKAARDLLSAVARLLAISDLSEMAKTTLSKVTVKQELREPVNITEHIKEHLTIIKSETSTQELLLQFKTFNQNLVYLSNHISRNLNSVEDPKFKSELASILSTLAKNSPFLYTSSKAFLKHSNNEIARLLRDRVIKEQTVNIQRVQDILKNNAKSLDLNKLTSLKNPICDLIEFDIYVLKLSAKEYLKERIIFESKYQEMLQNLVNLASNELVDENRKTRIYEECSALTDALNELIAAFTENRNEVNSSVTIEQKRIEYLKRSQVLQRQFRKAVADFFSIQLNEPLENLIDAALSGDEDLLDEYIGRFNKYAQNIFDASYLASITSFDAQGIQMVEMANMQLKSLQPQLIYAARLLCVYPTSNEVVQNMHAFKDAWLNQLNLLTLAVDDILPIIDFLSVCETSIHQDIARCVNALNTRNLIEFAHSSTRIQSRTVRLCDLVQSEMHNYEPCSFTNEVLGSVSVLKNTLVPNLAKSVEYAKEGMKSEPIIQLGQNEFIDASRLVYDGVRDIRDAMLLISDNGENQSINGDYDEESEHSLKQSEIKPPVIDTKKLTVEQREALDEQIESINKEKFNFDREVLKWDDKSNDIVVWAKEMCMIIMDMTEFMKGQGPLSTMTEFIASAKKISAIGSRLEKLSTELANECPESQSKRELLIYIKQMPLFCNQLSIACKVKENVIDPDSATSLLIASKNLMNTVISTVKTSYLASTKYTNKPIVQWRMKLPEKKAIYNQSRSSSEAPSLVRRSSFKKKLEPAKLLSEFRV